jgi:ankyrin repeat protein
MFCCGMFGVLSDVFGVCYRCVKALVEAGAQVDMPTKSSKDKNKGAVALHYAAQENRHDIVEYLIRQSAGVNIQDARGCTPLHYAVYTGRLPSLVPCV